MDWVSTVAEKKDETEALRKLTDLFRRLGAPNPESWARSELQEGTQLGRFVFLRALWDAVLRYPVESRDIAIEVARDLCYLLDGPPVLIPPELTHLRWGLWLENDKGPTQRLPVLVESFDEAKPE